MSTPIRRLASVTAAVAVLAAPTACSSDGPASQTPRISAVSNAELTDLLLRAEDVSIVGGLDGAEATDLDEATVFQNPDPRTPCGIPVAAPPLEGASARVLTGPTINVAQYVVESTDATRAYLDALLDDDDACGGYSSTTNTGEVQRVGDITVYGASGEGVDGLAWTNLVEIGGAVVYAGSIVVEADEKMTILQIRSASPIPAEGIDVLTQAAVLRLRPTG